MSIQLRSTELSPAEASFLKWQYGFDEADEPFERALWQAIVRAWEADNAPGGDTVYLERLGCSGAYPEEVALYLQFKSEASDDMPAANSAAMNKPAKPTGILVIRK